MEFQLGKIGQIARHVADIVAARKWYGDVLGLHQMYSFGELAFFDCGGTRLFLSQSSERKSESVLYFQVPDINDTVKILTARGVVFSDTPHMIHRHSDGTEEWMTFFEDNEGQLLALMAKVRPEIR